MKNRSLARRCLALGLSTLTALVVVAGCADFSAEPTTFDVQPTFKPADLSPSDPQNVPPSPSPNSSESNADGPGGTTAEEDPCRPADPTILAACLDAPWGLAVLPDGMSALVGERTTGRILRVAAGVEPEEVLTIPGLDSSGDGGLMGIALSPYYNEDGLIYVYATTDTDNRVLRIARGDTPKPIFTGIPKGDSHNGGRIAFGYDGYLYIATGDAGDPATAADPESLSGKILQLDEFGQAVTQTSAAPLPPPPPTIPSGTQSLPSPAPSSTAPETSQSIDETTEPPTDTTESAGSASQTTSTPTGSAVFATGLTNPTGMCLLETGGLAVIDRDGANDVLIPVSQGSDLTQTARLWSYPVTEGGANDCATGNNTVAASSLDGQQVVSLNVGVGGAFTGQPEILVKEVYGRLLSLDTAAQGQLIATTSNRDGFGEPKPRDDMVVIFPGGGGGGDGPD